MSEYIGKGIATLGVCALGAFSMHLTGDHIAPTGVGWAILGVLLIWGS